MAKYILTRGFLIRSEAKSLHFGALIVDQSLLLSTNMPALRRNGYHFVSFMTYISGVKFEEHGVNIFRDTLHF